jgi:hypothetical protein
MRVNEKFIFRVFFHKLLRVRRRKHQEQKHTLKFFKVSPLLLLVLSGVIIMTNFPQQNEFIGDSQAIFPKSSNIIFEDSMRENQTLEYQTNYEKTSGTCSTNTVYDEDDIDSLRYTDLNTTQVIVYDSINDVLNVNETYGYSEYIYKITSSSNVPIDQTPKFPFDNGWQHNYPTNNAEITLNAQEVTFLIVSNIYQVVLDFEFLKNENLIYDDITIPTKVFNATSNFQANFDDG